MHFLIRTCADRLCGDGSQTVGQQMEATRTKGLHRVEFQDPHGHVCQALLTLSFQRLRLLPSRAKRSRYLEFAVTVIHAREKAPPEGHEPIDWKLVTDLPVRTRTEAVEKLRWYALRWKIEVFHHIPKSGCRIEESRLRRWPSSPRCRWATCGRSRNSGRRSASTSLQLPFAARATRHPWSMRYASWSSIACAIQTRSWACCAGSRR